MSYNVILEYFTGNYFSNVNGMIFSLVKTLSVSQVAQYINYFSHV